MKNEQKENEAELKQQRLALLEEIENNLKRLNEHKTPK